MSFFRSPEIKKSAVLYGALLGASALAGFFFCGWRGACLAAGVLLLSGGLHFVLTTVRYRQIARLSEEIDAILHGEKALRPDRYQEGELGVLYSEIYKMTIRLREQTDALCRDKAELADLIADISHQLRTPLTSMSLMVSFLLKPDLPEERRLELAKDLSRLLFRIDWLIASLLKLSRIDAGAVRFRREEVDAAALVRKAADPLLVSMDLKEQRLNVRVEPGASFSGDLGWTAEALGNILKNCMEHTPAGGEISVSASENAVFTEIAVTDTGPGIPAKDLPRLFDRFYKGSNASPESVGIGLALARSIVEGQEGSIRAGNRPEGGAVFTIRFYKSTI